MATFNYLNFDISLSKSVDAIVLRFLDRVTYEVYQKIFDNVFIIQHGLGSIKNLYTILHYLLQSKFICSNNQNNNINILIINSQIKITISYDQNDFQFNFNFTIDKMIDNVLVDGRDLYIKKLEQEINNIKNNMISTILCHCTTNSWMIHTYIKKLILNNGTTDLVYDKNSRICTVKYQYLQNQLHNSDNRYNWNIQPDEIESFKTSFYTDFPYYKDHPNVKFV